MRYEIRKVDEKKGIVQITTTDERWYTKDQETFVPSVTWIVNYYYKNPYLIKWIANKGLDEAETIRNAAAEKGSRVHKAIANLLNGEKIKCNDVYESDGENKELSGEEWEAIVSFRNWWKEMTPELVSTECVVFTEKYAGTVDLICKIDGEIWLIDLKTSQNVYPSHILQVSAYKNAYPSHIDKLGILQIGYGRNKNGYKLNEIEDKFDLFMSTYEIWNYEVSQKQPNQKDLPLTVEL